MAIENNYNRIERLVHHVAFCHPLFQKILAELENDIFAREVKDTRAEKPVFVTALPRAGTTLLLELLYDTGEFGAFTYRQMPFVLAPLLWDKLSSPFQRIGYKRERAHGDGVEISFDSPEGFEEVLWLAFLKNKIVAKNVLHPVIPADLSEDFRINFRQVIQKLLFLQQKKDSSTFLRYLSKNNANISRISALTTLFPDAIILIPFRNPLTHVKSLITQHKRFLAEHKSDSFSKKYMEWIGHYEFGENFRPIDFDGELTHSFNKDNLDINFWVNYWSQAYKHCMSNASPNVHFIDFDALLKDGAAALNRIGEIVNISEIERFRSRASDLRNPGSSPIAIGEIASSSWSEAHMIYDQLCQLRLGT